MTETSRFLVDTSVWARVPGVPQVSRRLAQLVREHEVVTTTPVLLELGFSARSPAEWDSTMAAMGTFGVLHPSAATHAVALDLQRALWHSGRVRVAGAFDTLVAALAVEHDAIVLHYDRDFEQIARAVPTLRHEWVAAAGTLP